MGNPIYAAYAEHFIMALENYQCATLPLPSTLMGKNNTFLFTFSELNNSFRPLGVRVVRSAVYQSNSTDTPVNPRSISPTTTPSQDTKSAGNVGLESNSTQNLASKPNSAQASWPPKPSKWWVYVKFPSDTGCLNSALLYRPMIGSPKQAIQFIKQSIPYASTNALRWMASNGHESALVVITQKPPGEANRDLGFEAFGTSHEACLEAVTRGADEYGDN